LGFNGADSPRSRYFQWLRTRVIEPRLTQAPSLVSATVRLSAQIFDATCRDCQNEADSLWVRRHLAGLVEDLPAIIARPLRHHPDLRQHLDKVSQTVNTIGRYTFDPAPFVHAISAAADGAAGSVTSQDGLTFTVSRQDVGSRLHLLFMNETAQITLTGVANGALLANSGERRSYLETHAAEFDLTADGLRALIDDVDAIADPGQRVERVNAAVIDTCAYRYELIQNLLRSNDSDQFDMEQLLPPSLDSMLRFLRLDPNDPPETMPERAAERLLVDVGLAEALWRVSSVPVPLPACLMAAARALSRKEWRRIACSWKRRPTSPLSMLHLIRLLTEIEGPMSGLGGRIRKHLSHPRRADFHAPLMDTVGWAWHMFLHLPGYRDLPHVARLALTWCHADKLFSTFLAADRYVAVNGAISLAQWSEQSRHGVDVTFKRHLTEPLFLIQGLAYALGVHAQDVLGLEGRDLLRPALASGNADIPVQLEFHRVMQAAPNGLASFLGHPVEQSLDMLGFTDEAETIRSFREAVLDTLQHKDSHPWNWLVGLYPHGRPPQPIADRARKALLSIDVWSLCRSESGDSWSVLVYLADVAGWLVGPQGIDHVRDQIFKAAEQLGGEAADATARQVLASALAILASHLDDPTARVNRLAEDARTLALHCPAAAHEGRHLLRHLIEDLDTQEGNLLMGALLELRAYR
jgi:hypothetical protein